MEDREYMDEVGNKIADRPFPGSKKKRINLGCCTISSIWANLLFAIIAVTGQVGQNVTLPLWIDSTNSKKSGPTVDSYFVLSFASLSFVIVFGFGTLMIRLASPELIGSTERNFPHKLLALVGFCDAMNGVLVVFASSGTRTAPYLQAILGNFMIPLTMAVRFLILKKKPTFRKLICGLLVVLGLFICLLPTIFPKIDPNSSGDLGGATGVGKVLWPMCFMFGFMPAAIMNVYEEKSLKLQNVMSRRKVNLVYFLFWTSLYQLLTVGLLFWADILPGFGNVKNIDQFAKNWWFGVQCFFGGAGCTSVSGTRGIIFITMYVLSYVGGGNLLRYAEGATWLAIVTSLVTPLGFLFWTLFQESPFKWHPEKHITTWFSIGALAIMVPAIYFYNTGAPESTAHDNHNHGPDYQYVDDESVSDQGSVNNQAI